MTLFDQPDLAGETKPSDQDQPASGGARRRLWPFFRDRGVAGLDIGSSMIKLVLLHRPYGRVTLKQAAMAPTPPECLSDGEFTNSLAVASSLRQLFHDYEIHVPTVAVAVGGEKVIVQCDVASAEEAGDLPGFVERRAREEISYSWKSAHWGFQPIAGVAAEPQQAVLWVSAAASRVDFLREAVTLARKSPSLADAQACALANAYSYNHEPKSTDAAVLLHVGARSVTLAAVRGWATLFAREVALPRARKGGTESAYVPAVMGALDRYWENLTQRAKPFRLQRLFLSGGAAHDSELTLALKERTDLRIETLNPFRRISYSPASDPGKLVKEHGASLAVAAGLALRSFEDL